MQSLFTPILETFLISLVIWYLNLYLDFQQEILIIFLQILTLVSNCP